MKHEAVTTNDEPVEEKRVFVQGAHALLVGVKCFSCNAVTSIGDPSAVAAVKRGERLRVKCGSCGHVVVSAPIPKTQRKAMAESKIEVVKR